MHWRLEKGGKTWTDNQGERGVATALLAMAIETEFARGAAVLEAYPTPQRAGENLAAAFAWTGTRVLIAKTGFKPSPHNTWVWVKKRPRQP